MAAIGVFTPHVMRVDGGEQGKGDSMSRRRMAVVTAASGMLLAAACVTWLASPDGGLGRGVKPTTLYEVRVIACLRVQRGSALITPWTRHSRLCLQLTIIEQPVI
jgi:hypothetical protein